MAELAVQVTLALIDKALMFLHKEISRNKNVVKDVEGIRDDMSSLKACLLDAEEGVSGQLMNSLVEQIRDLSHAMEDVLDEFMIHIPRSVSEHFFIQKSYEFGHDLKHWKPVRDLQSQIAHIKGKMWEIRNSPDYDKLIGNIPTKESSHRKPREQEIVEEDDAVGIDLPKQKLIHLLASDGNSSSGDSRCKTISVVGPGGSGKTLLVNAVYKRKTVMGQFDCHAWLSIPYSNTTELLRNLVSQMSNGTINLPSTGDPATTLSNYLRGKRYLVVLDYVRNDQDWKAIRSKLPDNHNGSRIIVTTQSDVVSKECSPSDDDILRVNGLDQTHSWTLLCNKAFGRDGKCPPHLQALAQGIVTRCEGWPLAISAVGSLLSRKGEQPVEWKRIHDNLGGQIQENCSSAMLPSYYDRSNNLKACLLYFSILPEDRSIKRERLIRLWLSEGLVEQLGNESPETAAEDSLNELISRNLVTVSSRDFRGRVRSCRVQNLIREIIVRKSKDAKFIELVKDSPQMHPGQGANEKTRRLAIEYASSSCLARAKGFKLDTVRSLFMFGFDNSSSSGILETLQRVRLLKILDLENAPLDAFPDCILDVACLLRYLSLRNTKVSIVPKKIKRLRYLEYLDLKETKVIKLPEEICSLQYLQHLLVSFGSLQGVEIVGELGELQFLRKLSILKISDTLGFFEFLGKLTLLKKLGLVNLSKNDGKRLCACIKEMSNLSTLDLTSRSKEECLDLDHMEDYHVCLQHLYLRGRLTALPRWFPSLSGLVRLLLRWSKLRDSPVELLQNMHSLMELEMNDAFTGEVLLFEARGFRKLRTLHIEQFDGLDTVQVFADAMPMLQKLTFVRCHHLHHLPFGIKELRGLQELLLWDMPPEFTGKLSKNSGDRDKVNHVPCIRSYTFNANKREWEIHNFS